MSDQDWEEVFFKEVSGILDCVNIDFETDWYASKILANALEIVILKHERSCNASHMIATLKKVIAKLVKKYHLSPGIVMEGIATVTHYQVMTILSM